MGNKMRNTNKTPWAGPTNTNNRLLKTQVPTAFVEANWERCAIDNSTTYPKVKNKDKYVAHLAPHVAPKRRNPRSN